LEGSLWNQKWCLKEPFSEGSLKKYLTKWYFIEPWFERFFVEPEMVPYLKVLRDTFIGSLKNFFRKWLFKRTLVWKVLCRTRNGALKNTFLRFFDTHLEVL